MSGKILVCPEKICDTPPPARQQFWGKVLISDGNVVEKSDTRPPFFILFTTVIIND
jgi:hypothetical protein